MRRRSTKGRCGYCSNTYSGRGMSRHLRACEARQSSIEEELSVHPRKTSPIFLLKVSSGVLYWLFIEVDGSATLEDLDSFLRDIWVECCNHLSCFKINGLRFDDRPFPEIGSETMDNVKLADVLSQGLEFEYEYDFGSTTYLDLKVICVRKGKPNKDPVHLISRNNPLDFKCSSCGKKATTICSKCMWDVGYKGSVFCDDCFSEHGWDEYMASLIVNSPRMGVCGYSG